jgi:hypothetical protein
MFNKHLGVFAEQQHFLFLLWLGYLGSNVAIYLDEYFSNVPSSFAIAAFWTWPLFLVFFLFVPFMFNWTKLERVVITALFSSLAAYKVFTYINTGGAEPFTNDGAIGFFLFVWGDWRKRYVGQH